MESQAALERAGPAHGQYSDPERTSQRRTPSGPVVLDAEETLIRDNVWALHLPAALPQLPCCGLSPERLHHRAERHISAFTCRQ